MKKLLPFLLLILLLPACASPTPIRAAYLVHSPGRLPQSELRQHPEIFVTGSFSAFQRAARRPIGLWIDINALPLVDSSWLDQLPQAAYPIVVVGYNDTLRSFKYGLSICCFLGPADPDFSGSEPGFSVIQRLNGELGAPTVMVQGFKQVPHAADILRISNALLDGKLPPTPTDLPPHISSPTMP